MVATLRQFVRVEPGGIVRVQSSDLHEGEVAEVLVITAASRKPDGDGIVDPSWEKFIGSGVSTGRTPAQIDADLRELRDEWDR